MIISAGRDLTHPNSQLFSSAPKPIRNPLTRALLWASKIDPHVVEVCSRWTIATQCALGLFVCFTALLAFGAAYYTLATLNAPGSWAAWIAVLFSLFIGALDRDIVGGLDKKTAVVRPILSLFIGTIVAIPIELWVFQDRIDQDLQKQYRLDNKDELDKTRSAQAHLDQRRSDLQAQLADLRKQEAEWGKAMDDELVGRPKAGRSGIGGPGPVFENAKAQQSAVRQRLEDTRRQLDQLERSIPIERERIEKQFQREEIGKVTTFTTRYEAMDRVIHNSKPLYRLSWIITLTLILIEMTPAVLKLLTPHVDYHHLVRAEIRENVARIDEIADRNYKLAIQNPESPELSVSEKFAIARFSAEPGSVAPTVLPPVAPPIDRPVAVPKPDPNEEYLEGLCDALRPLFGDMPKPVISIRPSTEFENANAHCVCSEPCRIEFNADYLRSARPEAIENTMKHELIHAWIHFKRITDSDVHGHIFIMKGREVGCDVVRYEAELDAKRRATGAAAG